MISCRLKPIRGGTGTLYFFMNPRKPLTDMWYQHDLYYKFGTIYRKWLLSLDLDLCEALTTNSPSLSIQSKMTAVFWRKHVTKEVCPFSGPLNFTINADNSSSNIAFDQLPRLPQGDYKTFSRFHTKLNETILWYELKLNVKSKFGVNRTSMLDMG